jgi:DNA-binding CsgD family transcriptional regulator
MEPKSHNKPPPSLPLSPRECELILVLADGKSNKEIGAAMGITEGTVKQSLLRIFAKLGVKSRHELMAWYWHSLGLRS